MVHARPTPRPRLRPRRGLGLIYGFFIAVVILGFALLGVDWGRVQLAQAGLQTAADAAARAAAGSLGDGMDAATAKAIEVAAWNNATLRSADIVFGKWDPEARTFTATTTSPNAVQITAKRSSDRGNALSLVFGSVLGASASNLQASATAMRDTSDIDYAIVGLDSVLLNGNASVDSYDSKEGPYDSHSHGNEGSVATNGTITLNGNVKIYGNVYYGNKYQATGNAGVVPPRTATELDAPLVYPLPILPDSYINGGAFNKNGNSTTTLTAGTYYYKRFTLNGNAKLEIIGEVDIYVDGPVTLNGNIHIDHNLPLNFHIRSLSSSPITLNGNSDLYADIYAPLSPITLNGNAGFYGKLLGKSLVNNGNTSVHYDKALIGYDPSPTSSTSNISLVR